MRLRSSVYLVKNLQGIVQIRPGKTIQTLIVKIHIGKMNARLLENITTEDGLTATSYTYDYLGEMGVQPDKSLLRPWNMIPGHQKMEFLLLLRENSLQNAFIHKLSM